MTASGSDIAALRRTLAARPGDPVALVGLFAALDAAGQAGLPEEAVSRSNYGEALRRQGRLAEAEAHHRRAVAWLPQFGGNHFNLAVTLQALGRTAEAADGYGEAARLMPDFAGAPCNQGAMLRELGRFAEAETALCRALAIDAGLVAGWLNLAAVWRDRGDQGRAIRGFRMVLSLRPELAEGYANLALSVKESGQHSESIEIFERALVVGLSDEGGVLAQLVQQRRHLCRWDGLAELSARLSAAVRDGRSRQVHPWIFLGQAAGPMQERVCAERYTAWRVRSAQPVPAPRVAALAKERLRIGYLSADFHEHATAVLIAELVERHDRSRFEIVGLSYGADDGGAMRRRLIRGFDRFLDLTAMPDADAAAAIRETGIDILVDLKGYTQNARPGIAACRPAPVQAQWLGYPGTMGAGFIDWIVADATVLPPTLEPAFSERVVRLPVCYQPNDRTRRIGTPPSRADCGLPADGFVFCCFNAAYKIAPAMFDLWCRLLEAVPGSVLWLLESHPEVSVNLRREARRRGVAPERLVFSPRLPHADYLARYRLADLFVDTSPVGAHTTASDALWAGLPVLTLVGDSFVSRVGASLLRAVGLEELAAPSTAAYEETALRLARDPAALGALRARLVGQRDAAPLFDTDRFARDLEAAFLAMWAAR